MNTWFTSDHHFGHGRIIGYCNRPWWRVAQPHLKDLDPAGHLAKVARRAGMKRDDRYGFYGEIDFDAAVKDVWAVPDVDAMEEALVLAWNGTEARPRVRPGDVVHHLGDFAWWHLPIEEVMRIKARLNGTIHLVRGNHDRDPETKELTAAVRMHFGSDVPHARKLVIEGVPILMYHYGPRSWNSQQPRSGLARAHLRRIQGAEGHMVPPRLWLHGHSHASKGVVVTQDAHLLDRELPAVDMSVEGWGYAPASLDEILARVEAER